MHNVWKGELHLGGLQNYSEMLVFRFVVGKLGSTLLLITGGAIVAGSDT